MNHETLILIGNGASIASSDKTLLGIVGPLSISNFLEVIFSLEKLDNYYKARNVGFDNKKFDYILGSSEYYLSNLKKLSKKYQTNNICDIYDLIKKNEDTLLESEDIHLLELDDLQSLIYSTVMKYYSSFEKKYYLNLFNLVHKNSFPVVSLNWDINFETVIFEKTKIGMKHYYSEVLFNELSKQDKNDCYNPFVKILKPHGSLNQYFIGGPSHTYIGNLPETEYYLYIKDNLFRYDGQNSIYLLIPPFHEEEIPELDEKDIRNLYDKYNIKRLRILKGIRQEIRNILKDTKTLIIIGYSFLHQDKHILELFQNNKIEKIYVFDTDENVYNRISSYSSFNYSNFHFYKNGFKDIFDFNLL